MKNLAIVRALTAAKKYLAMNNKEYCGNKFFYICYTINVAAANVRSDWFADFSIAKEHVVDMLGNHTTVEEYLRVELKIPSKLLTRKNIQEFRLRWINHMIEEFS